MTINLLLSFVAPIGTVEIYLCFSICKYVDKYKIYNRMNDLDFWFAKQE